MTLERVTVTRLEKAATDNGFDLERGPDGDWLVFGSSHASLQVSLTTDNEAQLLVGLSRADVADALADLGIVCTDPIPRGAAATRGVDGLPALHQLLRRAFQLARALPDEPLKAFLDQTANLPKTTEAERLAVQRIGQELFRDRLLDYWEGRCAITGLAVPEILRASHIKPWADCGSDAERLDVFNGLLLAPHLDAVFDRGLITVADDGRVLVSPLLDGTACTILGVGPALQLRSLHLRHRPYLPWHRKRVFQSECR